MIAQANRSQTELHCVRCGQSGHLSKDCPWPAQTSPRRAHLPLDVARCMPSCCVQMADCARANDWPSGEHIRLPVVDASAGRKSGDWCSMFIDSRGVALRGAA
jgi:hypothetical protein